MFEYKNYVILTKEKEGIDMKNLNRILIFLFIVIDGWYVYDHLSRGDMNRLEIALAVIPVLLAPWLIDKILHYKMSETLKFVYYLFTFACVILGSVLNLYNIPETRCFDKVTHFISGFLTSIVALMILKYGKVKTEKKWFVPIFIILFSVGIAGIWEFFEYFMDMITGGDTQHVLTTGVGDSMDDMLVATLASILFSIYYYYQVHYAKKNQIEMLEKHL